MKKLSLFASAVLLGAVLASCGGNTESSTEATATETPTETEAPAAEQQTWNIDASTSVVNWKGSMVGVYDHFGTINITEGSLLMEGNNLVGGSISIDMASMNPTDENYSEEHPAADLIGHLSSPDFFDVANFPTATFDITGSDMAAGTITGNLTLRGKSNEETVTGVVFDEATSTATGTLVFDRQKYDVAWASTTKDMVLSDDIELTITLKPAM